jgi:hypothetical protein
MRTIKRTILTLALAAAVALSATPAHARRRAAAPPPVKSQLTVEEKACRFWGRAYEIVSDERDKLTPITATLADARIVGARFLPDQEAAADVTAAMMRIVHEVYAHPEISGKAFRYRSELRCMQPDQAAQPTSADARVWR